MNTCSTTSIFQSLLTYSAGTCVSVRSVHEWIVCRNGWAFLPGTHTQTLAHSKSEPYKMTQNDNFVLPPSISSFWKIRLSFSLAHSATAFAMNPPSPRFTGKYDLLCTSLMRSNTLVDIFNNIYFFLLWLILICCCGRFFCSLHIIYKVSGASERWIQSSHLTCYVMVLDL